MRSVLRSRLAGAVLALTAMVGFGIVANPVPAAASSPCNSFSYFTDSSNSTADVPSIGLYTGNITCFLARGAGGDAVITLQAALDDCYGKGLAVDGSFGPLTQAALTQVQSQVGISADGVYGPQTRDTINWPWFASALPPFPYTCHRLFSRQPQ